MRIGYRGWSVKDINGIPTLCSPHQTFHWQPGENLAVPEEHGQKVSEKTFHGFYALKTPEAVFEYFDAGRSRTTPILIDIVGEVLLYGDVVEGDKGYRGEKAQVGTLLLPTISRISLALIMVICLRYEVRVAVTSGHTREVLERYRNLKARERLGQKFGKPRRCTAGGRAIASLRMDEFLL